MDSKANKKLIKQILTPFAKKYGFVFTKTTLLTRINDNVLHTISFDTPSRGFNCDVAMQPLYIPEKTIDLSLGCRINRFKANLAGAWGYGNEQKTIEELDVVIQLLQTNVMPWFEESGNPLGIVSFLESGGAQKYKLLIRGTPYFEQQYIGFSYLYLGEYDKADKPLATIVELFKNETVGWAIELRELANNIRMLAKNEPEKIKGKLEEYIDQTKAELKLR